MCILGGFLVILITTWHFEVIPEATKDITLGVDTAGVASVAYYADSIIHYAKRSAMGDSFVWSNEVVDSGVVQYYYGSVDLAVDKKSRPHIVYSKSAYNYYRPTYYTTKDSSGIWQPTLLDTSALGATIDTDTLDYPHVVYAGNGLWHQYWDGSNWIKEYIVSDYMYVSLVIDRGNTPHIGLGAPVIANEQRVGWLGYGVKDSSGWNIESMYEFDVRWPVCIAVDNICDPHLSFVVYHGEVYYLVKHSGTWINEDITSLNPFYRTLAIDNMVVHLLGQNSTFNLVRHIWKSVDEWVFEDIHTGRPRDLVIDKDGYLHCIILDGSEIMYGTTRPQPYIYETNKHTFESAHVATVFRLPLKVSLSGFNSIEKMRILDVSGRLINGFDVNENSSCLRWNGLDKNSKKIRTGVYFLVFEHKEEIYVQKIVIID